MRTLQISSLLLVISLSCFGQKEINDSKTLCKEQIKKCIIYTYENPSDFKDSVSSRYITDVHHYDLNGRLIKHEYFGYSTNPQSIISYSYKDQKIIKKTLNSKGETLRQEIQETDSVKKYLSIEKYSNNKFQSKNISYYDSLNRQEKYESYNEDGTLKFTIKYDYVKDSNIVKTFIKGNLREQIETISPTSRILTKFDKSGLVEEKIFENHNEDGTVREFCQVVYKNLETDFYFNCQKSIYDYNNRLTREISYQGRNETVFYYNGVGLLERNEYYDKGVLRQLTIYKYE